ncbi:ABC transporter ATP-binding protein [Streptomyces sp. NPDC014995]|uniref:ABC transporter ATP-binding protein n=1 Tax=Streptomyces sp. NPDC014995 TaxID=3364936 RepID=UPI003702E40E
MTLGALLAFAAFIGYLYPPVRNLGQLGLTVTAATAGAERVAELLDAHPAVRDPATPVAPWPVRGRVGFHGVSFRYPQASGDSVRDMTLGASPGELVLVTGPSGAGKSTLAKLLTRFYDPDSGVISLDGVPLTDVPLGIPARDHRAAPAADPRPQRHDPREHRLRPARRDGRGDQQAARSAAAHDFITALPDGYDTPLAPGTAALSGGQLQRVAIARAMLRAAPVLVLDEPTAGLDSVAARQVVQPLRRLMSGRTTMMITHDLSLAPDADRVLVIDEGRLLDAGTHEELMNRCPVYARLAEPWPGAAPTGSAPDDTLVLRI